MRGQKSTGLGSRRPRLQTEALRLSLRGASGKSLPLWASASPLETLSSISEATPPGISSVGSRGSKQQEQDPLRCKPQLLQICRYHSSTMQFGISQQGYSLGFYIVTDKHIIIVTPASEWGFVVYKGLPLILSLQPPPQPWRRWCVVITSMARRS